MVAALLGTSPARATPIAANRIHIPVDTDTLDACPRWAWADTMTVCWNSALGPEDSGL